MSTHAPTLVPARPLLVRRAAPAPGAATSATGRVVTAQRPDRRPSRPPHRRDRSRRIVLTARGRRAVRLLALGAASSALAAVLVLAWVTVAASVAPGASAGDGTAGVASGMGASGRHAPAAVVVVEPGDTLWQLAQEHVPGRDPRSVVTEIVALNGLGSAGVQAGAEVLVPVE